MKDFYKEELIRWLVYIWSQDNIHTPVEVTKCGSIRLGNENTEQLLAYVRKEMLNEHFYGVTEEDIFDALEYNRCLYVVEVKYFNRYCQSYDIDNNNNYIVNGWLYKYDQLRRVKPEREDYK